MWWRVTEDERSTFMFMCRIWNEQTPARWVIFAHSTWTVVTRTAPLQATIAKTIQMNITNNSKNITKNKRWRLSRKPPVNLKCQQWLLHVCNSKRSLLQVDESRRITTARITEMTSIPNLELHLICPQTRLMPPYIEILKQSVIIHYITIIRVEWCMVIRNIQKVYFARFFND